MSVEALQQRLDVVSASHPVLDRLAGQLASEAEANWRELAPSRPVRWSLLVRQYVLPLAEPLRERLSGDRLLGVLRVQTWLLLLLRALDDARDHGGSPAPVARAAWEACETAAGWSLPIDRDALAAGLGECAEEGDPCGPEGAARAALLTIVPSALAMPASWREGWDSLLALSIVLDDVEDAVADLGARRRTWVTELLTAEWSPADVTAGAAVAERVGSTVQQLCARVLTAGARWPLLTATATAMSPAHLALARGLTSARLDEHD
jgi:hypothetical protein